MTELHLHQKEQLDSGEVETVFELLEVIAGVACKLLIVLTDSMMDETEVLTLAEDQRNTKLLDNS